MIVSIKNLKKNWQIKRIFLDHSKNKYQGDNMVKICSSELPKIKLVKILKEETIEICPHCKEEIREKSMYFDGQNWFHRPCVNKGPICLAERNA